VTSKTLAKKIAEAALTKKAYDVTIMDLRKLTTMTEYFIVCSVDSDTQARAVAMGAKTLKEHAQAENMLSDTLKSLFAVAENYPQLKADANFHDLQAQVEGTENRITVARNRYIKSVQEYNISVRTFPNNLTAMVMGWQTKANFTVEDEKAISTPPAIKFDAPAPAAAPASPTSAGYQ